MATQAKVNGLTTAGSFYGYDPIILRLQEQAQQQQIQHQQMAQQVSQKATLQKQSKLFRHK